MRRQIDLFIMITLVFLPSPSLLAGKTTELAEFKAAIRKVYDAKEEAFLQNDPDKVVNEFYSEDAYAVGVQGDVHDGREAIRELAVKAVPGSTIKIQSVKTHVNGDSGWDWTNYYVTFDDMNKAPVKLIFLFLWEKRNGRWWCVSDVYVPGEITTQVH